MTEHKKITLLCVNDILLVKLHLMNDKLISMIIQALNDVQTDLSSQVIDIELNGGIVQVNFRSPNDVNEVVEGDHFVGVLGKEEQQLAPDP